MHRRALPNGIVALLEKKRFFRECRSRCATPTWLAIAPARQDEKVLKEKFPKGYKVVTPYLRITPDGRK